MIHEFRRIVDFPLGDKTRISQSLAALDELKVSAVVLGNFGIENLRQLTEALINSKAWRTAYVQPQGYGFVFLRTDSELMRPFLETGSLDNLHYSDQTSRTLSSAFAYIGKDGKIPSAIEQELKAIVLTHPTALIYYAISRARGRQDACLNNGLRSYFEQELDRLSHLKTNTAQETYWALRSRLEILHLLDEDRRALCGGDQRVDYSARLAGTFLAMKMVRDAFFPWGLTTWRWP